MIESIIKLYFMIVCTLGIIYNIKAIAEMIKEQKKMNNFNVDCPYCGGRMTLKEVPNMKCMSYYCDGCNAVIHLSNYDEEYVKEFLNTIKKKDKAK